MREQKGYDPQIPHWDLCEINDQVHRLQSIFRNRLDFYLTPSSRKRDLVALILLLQSVYHYVDSLFLRSKIFSRGGGQGAKSYTLRNY